MGIEENNENCTVDWLITMKTHNTFVERENVIYVCVKNYWLFGLIQQVNQIKAMNKFTLNCLKNRKSVILMILFVTIFCFALGIKQVL